ncbi:hypothetical protein FHL15_001815 [Xylaria flabelliformis]|uniref:Myb-like domain-containing protein n=1 Tax=Xylaria flabelliformis TaxID=2512241 RepID=A0A553IBF8_9PEZI|nr:hypothetical protein FHL15_001815 [Xylaria flabelliformis]
MSSAPVNGSLDLDPHYQCLDTPLCFHTPPPLFRLDFLTWRSTAIVDIASLLKASDSNESSPSSQQKRSTSVPASTGPAVTTASSYGPPLYAAPPRLGGVAPMVAGTVGKRGVPPHLSEAPAKKQSKWSAEEDALIIDLRGSGMKWEDISKRLPGRSAISCRLHYQNYLERRSEWDEERKNKLARLYERFKPEMWAKVAEEMAIPWRAAEAMHWQLGEQDMARRAGVTPFSLSAQTLETTHGSSRASRHAHSTSQGGIPREVSHGRGYGGRGATMPPTRPLASRRESLPTHHLPPPPEHLEVAYGYPHVHGGGHLAPIQTHHPPPRPGMLPSVAELTTGVSPYSTPAYSVGVPSASPVHSATASPGPYMPPLGYPQLDPASGGSKRRRSPEGPPYETSRRRHFEPPPDPYDHPHSRR